MLLLLLLLLLLEWHLSRNNLLHLLWIDVEGLLSVDQYWLLLDNGRYKVELTRPNLYYLTILNVLYWNDLRLNALVLLAHYLVDRLLIQLYSLTVVGAIGGTVDRSAWLYWLLNCAILHVDLTIDVLQYGVIDIRIHLLVVLIDKCSIALNLLWHLIELLILLSSEIWWRAIGLEDLTALLNLADAFVGDSVFLLNLQLNLRLLL